jgi:ubiquinone/menaquinone biosynthesis C-methylase UbiE
VLSGLDILSSFYRVLKNGGVDVVLRRDSKIISKLERVEERKNDWELLEI